MNPQTPFLEHFNQLKEKVKDAEHLIEAILVRGPHVVPTYLTRMAQEYAEKYEINKEDDDNGNYELHNDGK